MELIEIRNGCRLSLSYFFDGPFFMDEFALMLAAASVFLIIASFSLQPSNRWNIPHSVFLVLIGIVIAFVIREIPMLAFLGEFRLSPELIFFVFLPTLLFESAFKFPLRKLLADGIPIFLLAVFGYLISVGMVTATLHGIFFLLGFPIPFFAILLFAVIISATDPVAVLSVFKKLGVTPRLTRLFEGESLFNDGTSFAMFLILISFLVHDKGDISTLSAPIITLKFGVMVLGGILFGVFMGYLFSWLIYFVRKEETIQLTLSLVMAHLTFILADLSKHLLHFGGEEYEFSAIIATVMASIILGSRGIQKFAPRVREHMDVLWEHFAFIANSLIFILIGMLTVQVLHVENLVYLGFPIIISLIVVVLARIVSVYIPLGLFNLIAPAHRRIPKKWLDILSWGSLRGAIAIAAILMIPDDLTVPGWTLDLSVKECITTLVVSCILFTTFIKAMMLEYFVERMELSKFSSLQTLSIYEGKILAITAVMDRLHELKEKGYVSLEIFKRLLKEYKRSKKHAIRKIASLFSQEFSESDVKVFLRLHALAIEKKILQTLLDHKEINEAIFWNLQDKLVRQEERVKSGEAQIRGSLLDLSKIKKEDIPFRYQITRARLVIVKKVLRRLDEFSAKELCIPERPLQEIMTMYHRWEEHAENTRIDIEKNHPRTCIKGEYKIFNYYTDDLEHIFIERLHKQSILDDRVAAYLRHQGLK